MSRLTARLLLVLLAATVVHSCSDNTPEWEALATNNEYSYEAFARTFHNNWYADEPFSIQLRSRIQEGRYSTVLTAGQCDDVRIFQTEKILYIFYRKIGLSQFSSFRYGPEMPMPYLCDLSINSCTEALEELQVAGFEAISVCTYSSQK